MPKHLPLLHYGPSLGAAEVGEGGEREERGGGQVVGEGRVGTNMSRGQEEREMRLRVAERREEERSAAADQLAIQTCYPGAHTTHAHTQTHFPASATTLSCGAKRANSRCQLGRVERGTTTRWGSARLAPAGLLWWHSAARYAMACPDTAQEGGCGRGKERVGSWC